LKEGSTPDLQDVIRIPFTTNSHGDFHVYFRLNATADYADSFWVQIDNNPFVSCDGFDTNGEWKWIRIVDATLLKGSHRISIAFRKSEAKLDRIYITNDPNPQAPTGKGGEETECLPVAKYFTFDFETGNIEGWAKQNQGREIDITQEDKHSGEYALKMVNGSGTSAWSVQAFTPPVDIVSGHKYKVTFWVRAVDGGGKGRISTVNEGQLGGQYWSDFTVGDAWQQITYDNLTAVGSSVRLAFDMGYVANRTYYIDDIVLEDITATPNPIVRVQGIQGLTIWDAGEVSVNESKQSGLFEVRNIGTDTLRVTGITELPASWSTSLDIGDGLTLGAGQVKEFTFTYAPTSEESADIHFTIQTKGGDGVIELKGAGIKTGLITIESSDVKIFSSAPGKINVTALDRSIVKITDILGRTKTYNVSGSSLEIPGYSGIYIVSVITGNKVNTRKVIVK